EKLPLQKALKQVNALLFPNSVVERHDRPLGTLVGIKAISLADLAKFHSQHYQPSNLVLFAEGGFSADELVEILGKSQFGQGTEVGWQNPLLVSEPVFHAPKFSRFEYRGNDWGFPEIGKKEVYLRGLVPVNKSPVPNFLLGAISNYAFKSLRVEQGLVYSTNQEFTSHFPVANQFTFGAVLGVAVDVDVVSQVWDDFLHWLETQECEDFVQKQQQQFLAKARFPEYYNWSYPQLSTIADNYFYSIPLSELSREAGIARWKNLKMEDVRAYIPYLQKYVMMIGHF
ncbi:MAG TPA: insulinase family protein, partial [bacterium]|nr:insulinase family protein [bacterium]